MRRRYSPGLAAMAVLVCASALPVSTASAASGGGQRIKAALTQLDLSPKQKEQVKQIVAEAKADRGTAQAGAAAGTAGKAKGHGAGRAMMQKIMAVLTQPQKAKFKQLMEAGRKAKA